MIVKHKCLGLCSKHDGVIIGWHRQCNERFLDNLENTIMFPYLRHLTFSHFDICRCKKISDRQPHYIILTDNNKICYVKQGMIISSILLDYICVS